MGHNFARGKAPALEYVGDANGHEIGQRFRMGSLVHRRSCSSSGGLSHRLVMTVAGRTDNKKERVRPKRRVSRNSSSPPAGGGRSAARPGGGDSFVAPLPYPLIGVNLRHGGAATTPSPLVGEGWGGGAGGCGNAVPPLTTPTPNPSPQGGGEEFADPLWRKLTPIPSPPPFGLPGEGGRTARQSPPNPAA